MHEIHLTVGRTGQKNILIGLCAWVTNLLCQRSITKTGEWGLWSKVRSSTLIHVISSYQFQFFGNSSIIVVCKCIRCAYIMKINSADSDVNSTNWWLSGEHLKQNPHCRTQIIELPGESEPLGRNYNSLIDDHISNFDLSNGVI